jgi:hypothetical protein
LAPCADGAVIIGGIFSLKITLGVNDAASNGIITGLTKMKTIIAITLACFLSACSSYSLDDGNGNKLSGSMMNGAASISRGAACTPAAPSSSAPTPPVNFPAAATPVTVCDPNGQNCHPGHMMMDTTANQCVTSVVNVRGTDITTLFAWIAAAGLGAFALAK